MECNDNADTSHVIVLPDACVEVFVNYTETPVAIIDDQLHKRSIVNSRMNRPTDVQMRKGAGCVAICFYPGMAHEFFQIPMHILSNTTCSLFDLWKERADELEESLAMAHNNELRVAILQQFLLSRLAERKSNQYIAHCLNQICLSKGMISLNRLTDQAGITQRHLSRKFQQHIGLSPKEYLRVSRFIHSLGQLKNNPQCSLTDIAYRSGYYDQAHFIRDYKDYTGHTPGEVLRSQNILF